MAFELPLHLQWFKAAQEGNEALLVAWHETHPEMVHAQDKDERTALYHASAHGHAELVSRLLAWGARVNEDENPLAAALWNGHLEIATQLRHADAHLASNYFINRKAWFESLCRWGTPEVLRYVLSPPAMLDPLCAQVAKGFWQAATEGRADNMHALIDAGMDLSDEDVLPGHVFSLSSHHIPVLDALKRGWPRFNAARQLQLISTWVRAKAPAAQLMDWAMQNNLDLNAAEQYMPLLHAAVEANSVECVKILLARGADVSLANSQKSTPLHLLRKDASAMVRLLLDAGADVHARDFLGSTPLINACAWTSLDTVKVLVDAGAQVNDRDDDGGTALHVAADMVEGEKFETCFYLIEKGADMGLKTVQGACPGDNNPELHAILRSFYEQKQLELGTSASPISRGLRRI